MKKKILLLKRHLIENCVLFTNYKSISVGTASISVVFFALITKLKTRANRECSPNKIKSCGEKGGWW